MQLRSNPAETLACAGQGRLVCALCMNICWGTGAIFTVFTVYSTEYGMRIFVSCRERGLWSGFLGIRICGLLCSRNLGGCGCEEVMGWSYYLGFSHRLYFYPGLENMRSFTAGFWGFSRVVVEGFVLADLLTAT